MGNPKLVRSPIHMRLANQQWVSPLGRLSQVLANQQWVSPLGRLSQVPVDIDRVRSSANFEVIEIIGDSRPYPALLGIDWVIGNMAVVDLKRRQMTFEDTQIWVIAPLDPLQGPRYIEPI